MTDQTIQVELSQTRKNKPNSKELAFGRNFTDHMFVMDYSAGLGWHNASIIHYQELKVDPAYMIFQYGQYVFEGLNACRSENGRVKLFSPEKNFQRLNFSNDRLVI